MVPGLEAEASLYDLPAPFPKFWAHAQVYMGVCAHLGTHEYIRGTALYSLMGLCVASRNAHCIGVGVGVALRASTRGCSWGANVKYRHTFGEVYGKGSSGTLLSQVCYTGVCGGVHV